MVSPAYFCKINVYAKGTFNDAFILDFIKCVDMTSLYVSLISLEHLY